MAGCEIVVVMGASTWQSGWNFRIGWTRDKKVARQGAGPSRGDGAEFGVLFRRPFEPELPSETKRPVMQRASLRTLRLGTPHEPNQ